MNLNYFESPSNTTYPPPVNSLLKELPLNQMSWQDFEKLCLRMVELVEGFDKTECEIFGKQGQKQDGIDIYAKKSNTKYSTFQCKKYNKLTTSELEEIIIEFQNGKWYNKCSKFYLCITIEFSNIHLQDKFETLKKQLFNEGISLLKWDYTTINRILKTQPRIVFEFFGDEWCKKFCGISIKQLIDIKDLKLKFKKASKFLNNVKNYFGKKDETHICRKETSEIINWVKNDLKTDKKNLLILKGEKGLGKTVILKDVYDILVEQQQNVLAIKADKYYTSDIKKLEYQLFLNDEISFNRIINTCNYNNEKLVIIIDQIDALSQAMSSNREFIYTYNRLINELVDEKNIRIIISTRKFDLYHDADLKQYNSNKFYKVETSLIDVKDVGKVLSLFNINIKSSKTLELLRTPNHLEIFCKLPNKERINLDSLLSLKDLYDKLWEDLIVNDLGLRLDDLLYTIANDMYNNGPKIIANNKVKADYIREFNYLESNQLLIHHKEENEIQFFHQTFYDYCFSRSFVENQKDILEYLNENEQNLEIRSKVKMVFEYLREFNSNQYSKALSTILKRKNIRFHIKLIIINNLGLLDPPLKKEKDIVLKLILKQEDYEEAFVDSAISPEWVDFMLSNKVFDSYLILKTNLSRRIIEFLKRKSKNRVFKDYLIYEDAVKRKRGLAWKFFKKNINKAPIKILSYLNNLDFADKESFIRNILISLDEWKEEKLIEYFEHYIFDNSSKNRTDEYLINKTLENLYSYHPEYVKAKVGLIFFQLYDCKKTWEGIELSHWNGDLMQKMYKIDPNESFDIFLNIYVGVIEDNKDYTQYSIAKSPLYSCEKFNDLNDKEKSKEAHVAIETYLIQHLKSKASNRKFILDFFEEHKKSNSTFILRILVIFLKTNSKNNYSNQIFELFKIIHSKNGFNGPDDKLQLYFRDLLEKSFSTFNKSQKNEVVKIILSIRRPTSEIYHAWEIEKGGKKILRMYGYGKKQFLFIKKIPKNDIYNYPNLKKKYQEFHRRFGEINPDIAHDVSDGVSVYSVGAPLIQNAYTKMTLKNWKQSMLKFNDEYKGGHGGKGGKSQHASEFEKAVENEPVKFYSFLYENLKTEGISIDYFIAGVKGLKRTEYDIKELTLLFLNILKLDLEFHNTLYLLWEMEYFVDKGMFDDVMLHFLLESTKKYEAFEKQLASQAKNHKNSNTIRGAVIGNLIRCGNYPQYKEIIFSYIEDSITNSNYDVRLTVVREIAYLNKLDLKRSFSIFKKTVDTDNEEILKASINHSQYFNKKYHFEMIDYFERIMQISELQSHGQVIVLSWLDHKIDDFNLFNRYIKTGDEAKECAIKMAENHLNDIDNEVHQRSLKILYRFLNEKEEKFSSIYSGIILRKFNPENFLKYLPFLTVYSKSKLCHRSSSYFIELLIESAKEYPHQCLELLCNINLQRIEHDFHEKGPTSAILAIYSKLMKMGLENEKDSINTSLNMFDSILKHPNLRASANEAIELTLG